MLGGAPEKILRNRRVGRERKGSATSGSTAGVVDGIWMDEEGEKAEVDERENASGCRLSSMPLSKSTEVRNEWASAGHALAAMRASQHCTVAGVVARTFFLHVPWLLFSVFRVLTGTSHLAVARAVV